LRIDLAVGRLGIWFDREVDFGLHPPIPILRMFDVEATKRFYVEYLGCPLDRQEGEGDQPVFIQVSRGPLVLSCRLTTATARLAPPSSFRSMILQDSTPN
jgi:Glyoxalase superfamily protein